MLQIILTGLIIKIFFYIEPYIITEINGIKFNHNKNMKEKFEKIDS